MDFEIKVPTLGESVTQATISNWLVKAGDFVAENTIILELETDKVSLEVYAPTNGVIKKINFEKGASVKLGDILALQEQSDKIPENNNNNDKNLKPQSKKEEQVQAITNNNTSSTNRFADVNDFINSNINQEINASNNQAAQTNKVTDNFKRQEVKMPMTRIRQKIAQRLKYAQNTAAMLTTFNEIDMTATISLRNQYKDVFEKKHGVKLGFMGFFTKACVAALKEQPIINAYIEDDNVVMKNYSDISIAVSTPNGLVVPVIRDAQNLNIMQIEQYILDLGKKAKDNKLSADDMSGGTFTITNGGVFGSLLSTPIINPPQSAILGLHKIQERPVVINNQIVIRSMMYVALSYDHRLIDGKEAVSFLVCIKEFMENPGKYLLDV